MVCAEGDDGAGAGGGPEGDEGGGGGGGANADGDGGGGANADGDGVICPHSVLPACALRPEGQAWQLVLPATLAKRPLRQSAQVDEGTEENLPAAQFCRVVGRRGRNPSHISECLLASARI